MKIPHDDKISRHYDCSKQVCQKIDSQECQQCMQTSCYILEEAHAVICETLIDMVSKNALLLGTVLILYNSNSIKRKNKSFVAVVNNNLLFIYGRDLIARKPEK